MKWEIRIHKNRISNEFWSGVSFHSYQSKVWWLQNTKFFHDWAIFQKWNLWLTWLESMVSIMARQRAIQSSACSLVLQLIVLSTKFYYCFKKWRECFSREIFRCFWCSCLYWMCYDWCFTSLVRCAQAFWMGFDECHLRFVSCLVRLQTALVHIGPIHEYVDTFLLKKNIFQSEGSSGLNRTRHKKQYRWYFVIFFISFHRGQIP